MRTIGGVLAGLAAVAVFLWGLRRSRAGRIPGSPRPDDESDVLAFDIVATTAVEGRSHAWRARYGATPGEAEFEIHILASEPVGGSPFAHGSVLIRRGSGSTAGAFVSDLARALGLSQVPSPNAPANEVECDASFMGSHLSRGSGPDVIAGSFTTTPPGDWIVAKVFFADGDGEVFLALNPVIGRGEFLLKDPESSEPVVRELGRLF